MRIESFPEIIRIARPFPVINKSWLKIYSIQSERAQNYYF